jgi:BMFP domain-containing protein YqiC
MSDPVIRRVRRSIDEAKNRGGMQAGMPKVTIDAGDVERLCIVAEALATTQAENEALRARVAELEAREDAMCDLSYSNGAEQGYSWGQAGDEAALAQCVKSRAPAGVAELKRLRQQADDAERAGGE